MSISTARMKMFNVCEKLKMKEEEFIEFMGFLPTGWGGESVRHNPGTPPGAPGAHGPRGSPGRGPWAPGAPGGVPGLCLTLSPPHPVG